jgi:enamine deaminase RidA (YjgF/YER057c/UK114 family)
MDAPTTKPGPPAIGSSGSSCSPLQTTRIDSGAVVEIHLCARPQDVKGGFETQARSMYDCLLEGLRDHDATPADLVAERLFLGDVGKQAPRLAGLRGAFYGGDRQASRPATTIVQQRPARPGQLCELQALALRPVAGGALTRHALEGVAGRGGGVVVEVGGLRHLFLSGVTGGTAGDVVDSQSEAAAMFRDAEGALRRAGLSFRDVVRTWIFVADVDRDYFALNRARRGFFNTRRIKPPPASTGIQGVPFPPDRACALDLRAIGGSGPLQVSPFGSPTMNEAPTYGADFSRGMRVETHDRTVLYVSGTASIDAEGGVFAPGDIDAQIERTLLNVEMLLSGQGAGWADVVSEVTYLKDAAYADAFHSAASRLGLPGGTPNTVCVADICRPEWLCEIEVTAILAPGACLSGRAPRPSRDSASRAGRLRGPC